MLCVKQWTGQQQTAATAHTHTCTHHTQYRIEQMLKALVSEIKTRNSTQTHTGAHSHTYRQIHTTIICNIEPFYRFPCTVCVRVCMHIHITSKPYESHTHSYAQSISSWSRTFCSYSACLLCRLLLTIVRRMGEKGGKKYTYVYEIVVGAAAAAAASVVVAVVVVVGSWYFLLFIMHINLNETTEAFVYSCRCYSVHAVDQMN